jgi:ribosomal protein S12 methylthiotransferase
LIEAIASNPKICNYIDMPLQHSEDSILKRMRRPGRQRDVRELVGKIRDRIPEVALRTSMIVGFPGETDEDFEKLCDFVREMKFDRLGVFAYSQEEDTPANRLPNQIADEVKQFRQNTLMEIQREVAKDNAAKYVGRTIEVLVEKYDGRSDVFIGRSQYDAPEVDGEVFITNCPVQIGELSKVRITHAYEYDLSGEGIA